MRSIAFASFAMLALLATGVSHAAVNAEEAQQLGTTLTTWGAQKAGNKDGTIPAYTGGMTKPPANYVEGSGKWVDPFPNEKPLFSIDAKNQAQYADKLTPGVQELMRRWPDYRVDVYPTHRTWPEMSKERAAATLKNATNPECQTTSNGVGIAGCSLGTPFPIPKTGYEAMWNHLVRERDEGAIEARSANLVVDSAGNLATPMIHVALQDAPYWQNGDNPYYYRSLTTTLSPAKDSGNRTLIWYPRRYDQTDQRSWSYTTGQRRVRLAPEFAYDTPVTSLGGVLFYDEANMFAGRMDRFDFKLVGKKEFYVPYNQFREVTTPWKKLIGKQHVNPDVTRWELHRVWVVEATMKPGVRHVASKRNYYIDEDSWSIVASEGFDHAGTVFRVLLANTGPNYITGVGGVDWVSSITAYDLARGGYSCVSNQGEDKAFLRLIPRVNSSAFSPEKIAASGVR